MGVSRMTQSKNMFDRKHGEEFEYYVERSIYNLFESINDLYLQSEKEFSKINERLENMATLAEQLGVEETTLAEVVPELATEITTLQTSLTEKEATITTDIATLGADSTELVTKNAELAAIQKVQESLAPVVEKAKSLIPASVTPPVETPPVEAPPVETPVTPPAEETPVLPTEAPAQPTPGV